MLQYSSGVSWSPSTSEWIRRETRSSVGLARRSSPIWRPYSNTWYEAGLPNGKSFGSTPGGRLS